MRRAALSYNTKRRKTAMRVPHVLWAASETPALRVAHEEIAKRLHARDRLQFFGINEIRIERRAFLFAEQLHEADVLLDQIIRQQRDADPALAGAQQAHDVVDHQRGLARALAVARDFGEPIPVLQVYG